MLIFYRGACTYRSVFEISTKPPILDIPAPFTIRGTFHQNVNPNNTMIKPHAEPRILVPFYIEISLVKVEANKTKEK
jgi:hypothetical protein